MRKLNHNENLVLERIQNDMPVTDEIFHIIAKDTSVPLIDVIHILKSFESEKIIIGISAEIRHSKTGYHSGTALLKVSKNRIDSAISSIQKNNYIYSALMYENDYNFKIKFKVPHEMNPVDYAGLIARETGADHLFRITPRLKFDSKNEIKNSPWNETGKRIPVIDLLDNCKTHDSFVLPVEIHHNNKTEDNNSIKIGEIYNEFSSGLNMRSVGKNDIPVIQILQNRLPLTENPFSQIISESGIDLTADDIYEISEELKKCGIIKKFSALMPDKYEGHEIRSLSFWKFHNSDLNRIIQFFRDLNNIFDTAVIEPGVLNREYNLTAGIYTDDNSELERIIKFISDSLHISEYCILKEIKKVKNDKFIYFS
ncbi:MAG: hypothetical protein JW982_04800 [Spirochaetes bacterium]|nr:hypothetical protein [Spirochaetota bacterium]